VVRLCSVSKQCAQGAPAAACRKKTRGMREREQPARCAVWAMAPGRRHFELHHPVRVKLLLGSTPDKGERKKVVVVAM
jgi:hypothetical protein